MDFDYIGLEKKGGTMGIFRTYSDITIICNYINLQMAD
jgi:hypothetical protein